MLGGWAAECCGWREEQHDNGMAAVAAKGVQADQQQTAGKQQDKTMLSLSISLMIAKTKYCSENSI
ncbi:hypothetical protein OUZ56_029282 [Daphnia magna]|uniref:Uncharacterized protein n=1 Tax=Daphnia magna TaxID=35525 RepID=A0ABR0B6D5_9CRUS|nr:hypothetical protein OUZ56_029282 [Daphnia magna]